MNMSFCKLGKTEHGLVPVAGVTSGTTYTVSCFHVLLLRLRSLCICYCVMLCFSQIMLFSNSHVYYYYYYYYFKNVHAFFFRNCDAVMQLISFTCLKFVEKFSKLNKFKEKYH
jgi:hypothetical protein